jgi:hypothetical protein
MLIPGPFGEFKGLLPNDLGFTHRHRKLPSAADQGLTWAASAQVCSTSVSGAGRTSMSYDPLLISYMIPIALSAEFALEAGGAR